MLKLDRIQQTIISLLFILLPVFFLPLTSDYIEINKQLLLSLTVIILLMLYAVRLITRKTILYITLVDLPFFVLIILSALSAIFASPYKMGSLFSLDGPIMLLFFFLLYFCIAQTKNEEREKSLIISIILGGTLLGLMTIAWQTNLTPPLFPNDHILNKTSFSPMGSPYFSLLYLFPVFILSLIQNIKYRGWKVILMLLSSVIMGISILILSVYLFKNNPIILPINAGLSITFDTWKSFPKLLFGVGPGAYFSAFTAARPIFMNTTPLWSLSFETSTSFLLTLATELGLVGTLVFLTMIGLTLVSILKTWPKSRSLSLLFLILAGYHIVTISNTALIALFFALGAKVAERRKIIGFDLMRTPKPLLLIPSLIFVLSIILFFLTIWVYIAEIMYKTALDHIKTNEGDKVYAKNAQAIKMNKYIDRYHRTFSQINLALANSLSAKKTLTREDEQNIPRLIQQAIDEARYTTYLYPTSINNWINLGGIYQSLIVSIRGSDKEAIRAYEERIKLTPTDPQSRFLLGTLYYSLGRNTEAITLFQQAIKLKPDWANAHYNLGMAYKQQKDYQKAYEEFRKTKALLPPTSDNIQKIEKEIEDLSLPSPTPAKN